MQSNILNVKMTLCFSIITLLISSCNGENNLKNQITIKINSVDNETKKRRVNAFDTIEVRKQGVGYLMKTFNTVGQYVTDSTGSVKIKIDRTEKYQIRLYGIHVYGGGDLYGEELKDGQEVNIDIVPPEKNKISW